MTLQAVCSGGAAEAWQRHCQLGRPGQFEALAGPPAAQRRAARFEELLIEQLTCSESSLEQRALALRSIVELRGCSTRDVARFFNVDSQVVIQSLMLMKTTAQRATIRSNDVHIPSKAA